MTLEVLTVFLAWCTLFNLVILFLWWLVLAFGGGWIRRMHGRWFDIGDAEMAAVHYRVLAHFKILWVLFNLTPYLVLRLIF
jgi:hypothetical protein